MSAGGDVYGSPNLKTSDANAKAGRCTVCGSPFASTIHMVNSANAEIRMGAHEFSVRPVTLDQAIEAAARDLPACFILALNVEKGAAWVEAVGIDFHFSPDGADRSLAEQVLLCVEAAKAVIA